MNVVVTGAGKGIGLALVKSFLSAASHRVWACSRDISQLKALKSPNLIAEKLDITQVGKEHFFEQVSEHFDHLDILVHNAGMLINKPFAETSVLEWLELFQVNLFSAVKISQALLPLLQRSAGAHIVHIGSMGGFQGSSKFPGLSAYSASKAALANLTECMAEELKSQNIHVNCLALGAVNTEMLRQAFPEYQAPVSDSEMAEYIGDFCIRGRNVFNGKIIPVSSSTP